VRTLKTKVLLNFSSTILPMMVGLFTIPLLIDKIGVERFGLLSIAWMIVGYFGVLDMGLGRALTQKIAQKIGSNDTASLKNTIFVGILAVFALGVIGAIVLSLSAHALIYELFLISPAYLEESYRGAFWIALTIPLVMLSTALLGVLEGQQHFEWTAIVRTPMNLFMFIAPLVATLWSSGVDVLFLSLFVVRLFALIALVLIVIHTLKPYKFSTLNILEIRSLFVYGGWITASNIISPIMTYFDRFYIASVIGASIVAYYTTPLDMLSKALLIPLSLVGVMFTVFSTEWNKNKQIVYQSYRTSIKIVALFMALFCIIVFMFAKFGLTLWLGESFAEESYRITQIIALGIFVNAMAMVPYALIQGIGRADITAKFHLIELPIFLLALWFGVTHYGLIGAAYAWSFRVLIDAILLYFFAYKILKQEML